MRVLLCWWLLLVILAAPLVGQQEMVTLDFRENP